MKTVYLCGPLRKGHEKEDLGWRHRAYRLLTDAGAIVLDPARGHGDALAAPGELYKPNELVHRDEQDVWNSDIILANLETDPGSRPSVGSLIEIGIARGQRKPKLIAVASSDPNIREHLFIQAIATMTFEDIDAAIDFVTAYWL